VSAPQATEPTDAQRTARDDLVVRLHDLLLQLAVDGYGATRHEDPIEGFQVLTHTRIEPMSAGIQAALLIRDVGTRLVRDWAEKTCASGRSWDEVGEALGLLQEGQDFSRAERAYEYVADGRELPKNDTGEWTPGTTTAACTTAAARARGWSPTAARTTATPRTT
jgi:hypothetical protein